jgi:hypothetical protein
MTEMSKGKSGGRLRLASRLRIIFGENNFDSSDSEQGWATLHIATEYIYRTSVQRSPSSMHLWHSINLHDDREQNAFSG